MFAGSEHPASFRDPSGSIFVAEHTLFRTVRTSYKDQYQKLMQSGLYKELVSKGLLIEHDEIKEAASEDVIAILKPKRVPFISYPQEWCFSQLKDAALLTLNICEQALQFGMILKDASAYNIQFINAKPVLIDTLSFDHYVESAPWVAYRQFCQHFLAPLALMAKCDIQLGKLSQIFIDGVPLELASKLLPRLTRFSPTLGLHIHLHARSQKKHGDTADTRVKEAKVKVSKNALRGLLDSLRTGVQKLSWNPAGTQWGDYYQKTNYSQSSMQHKEMLVQRFLSELSPTTVWDLGANTGVFSEVAVSSGADFVLSADIDPAAVEKNYRRIRSLEKSALLPIIIDLTNPTPAYGWAHKERMSLADRGPCDAVLALALIHHLAVANNLPLERIASFFSELSDNLIIEFIPKSDTQVQKLLASRPDIFPNYTQAGFESAFKNFFSIQECTKIEGSDRVLYFLKNQSSA